MTLATRFFFWDDLNWDLTGPQAQPPARRFPGGSGGRAYDKYTPLGDDYWTARETSLRGPEDATKKKQQEPAETSPETLAADAIANQLQEHISEKEEQLKQTKAAATSVRDPASNAALANYAMQLSIDISKLREQYYERARALNLLDVL